MEEYYYRGVSEALQYAIRFLEDHDKDIAVDEFKATMDQLRHGIYVDFRVD